MKSNKKINTGLLISVSVVSCALAIAFIIQVLRIYNRQVSFGESLFTRDIVGHHIKQILALLIVWVIIVVISGIYTIIYGKDKDVKAKPTNMDKLHKIESMINNTSEVCEMEEYIKLKTLKKYRLIGVMINCVILCFCLTMTLCYVLNSNNFVYDGEITHQISQMALHIMPWIIISFLSSVGLAIYNSYNAKDAIDCCKAIIKNKGKANLPKVKTSWLDNVYFINAVRGVLVVTAIVCIITGALNGGASGVLTKAANICTECIGLG